MLIYSMAFPVARATPAESTSSDSNDNSYTIPREYDPEAADRAYEHAIHQTTIKAQSNASRAEAEKKEQDKDWLLRDYEQQLKVRSNDQSQGQNANVYEMISSDKELAKLAGLSNFNSSRPEDTTAAFLTGNPNSAKSTLQLRTDPSLTAPPVTRDKPLMHYSPLITPLTAPEAAGLHNFYSTLPAVSAPMGPADAPSQPAYGAPSDPSAIETPGMIAAESDPLHDKIVPDLSLDLHSDELPTKSADDHLNIELPPSRNAERAQKSQLAALTPPGGVKVPPPAPINPLLLQDKNEPSSEMVPAPSPIRSPIADPHDFSD